MTSRWVAAALAIGIMVLGSASSRAQVGTAEALFREALAKERAEGALKDAVFGYERIIADFAADRQAAGKSMYQLALIYERLGDPRATVLLNRLVADYPTVEPAASLAKARLKSLQSDAASPFHVIEVDKDYELGSPDGRLVVYHKSPADWGRLYLKDLATGKERLLIDESGASVSNIAWSPDSRRLAYNFGSADNKVNDIRIAAVESGESRSLGTTGYPTAWTTADEILFYRPVYKESRVDWSVVAAGGGDSRRLFSLALAESSDAAVAIAPDGARCLLSKSKKLYVHDLKSGQSTALTTGTWEESRPQVSADSRLVAFQANPDGRWGLYVAPLDGALPVEKPLRLVGLEEPTKQWSGWAGRTWWTSTGVLTYLFRHTRSDLHRIEMDPKTGRAVDSRVRLTQDAADNFLPAVSPDGRRIAYFARNGTKGGLAVMNADGTDERPLGEKSVVLPLAWRSPSEILFRQGMSGEPGAIPIVSLNIETGFEQVVAQPDGVYWYYSPERREILHLYAGAGGPRSGATLKALSITNGREHVVAQIDFLGPQLAVTSDGRRVAYMTYQPVDGSAGRLTELGVLTLDGSSREVLIPKQSEAYMPMAWSPDGRYLLYKSQATEPRIMEVASRKSWPLCGSPQDEAFCKGLDTVASWAPDGRFIVVCRSEEARVERLAWDGVTGEAVAKLMRRQ